MFVIAGLNSAGLRGAVLLGTDAIIGFVNGTMRAVSIQRWVCSPHR